jgi:hypothetical protein
MQIVSLSNCIQSMAVSMVDATSSDRDHSLLESALMRQARRYGLLPSRRPIHGAVRSSIDCRHHQSITVFSACLWIYGETNCEQADQSLDVTNSSPAQHRRRAGRKTTTTIWTPRRLGSTASMTSILFTKICWPAASASSSHIETKEANSYVLTIDRIAAKKISDQPKSGLRIQR